MRIFVKAMLVGVLSGKSDERGREKKGEEEEEIDEKR